MSDYWKGKRVVITGGASLIGSHLTEQLLELGAKVQVYDNLYSGVNYVPKGVEFSQQDLRYARGGRSLFNFYEQGTARGDIGSLHKADVVFHLACKHGGRGYVDTHEVDCYDNLSLDATVFRMCFEQKVDKVYFMSSACAYSSAMGAGYGDGITRVREDDLKHSAWHKPDGAYGWSKLSGEKTLNAYVKRGDFKGVIGRGFTVYGPRMKLNHAVLALIAKSTAKQDPFEVWGDGKQVRNWTFVDDTVRGILLAAEQEGGAYNIGSENIYHVYDLLNTIWDFLGWRPKEIKYLLDKPTGPSLRLADATKLKLLGWSEHETLLTGVQKTMNWYEKNSVPESELERLLTDK